MVNVLPTVNGPGVLSLPVIMVDPVANFSKIVKVLVLLAKTSTWA